MTDAGALLTDPARAVYVWLARSSAASPKPQPYLARWPAEHTPLTQEMAIRAGYATATHALVGPLWPGREIRVGDIVTSCRTNDGRDLVLGEKHWVVVGRSWWRGVGMHTHQAVYVQERE